MLTQPELKLAGFVEHELIVPLAEKDKKRWLFVTQDVDDLLSGKLNPEVAFPSVAADHVLGRISKGLIVSVTRSMSCKADFKQLKGLDEAWTIQLPGPGAGWRLFGRFARKNVFVGFDCRERGDCAPLTKYNEIAIDMIGEWNSHLPLGPLTGSRAEDYLGVMVYEKDW